MKLRFFRPEIEKKVLYRVAFNEACNMLVRNGFYKSTQSAEMSIMRKVRPWKGVVKSSNKMKRIKLTPKVRRITKEVWDLKPHQRTPDHIYEWAVRNQEIINAK